MNDTARDTLRREYEKVDRRAEALRDLIATMEAELLAHRADLDREQLRKDALLAALEDVAPVVPPGLTASLDRLADAKGIEIRDARCCGAGGCSTEEGGK